MLMKNSIKHLKIKLFNTSLLKNFATANQNNSISMRFHNLYIKELERIQKSS